LPQDLASALSAVLVPELNEITTVLSETLAAFKAPASDTAIATLSAAVASLETSAEALNGATENLRGAVQDLASRPMLVSGLTPDQLQSQLGAPEYDSIEDGWFLDKYDIRHNQKQGFLNQVEFFSERLRELDETANKDTTAYLDEPRELFMREQAKALRELYAKMLLELLARSKSLGGVGEESFDAGALELARQYGDKTTDKIAPAMGEVTQTSPMKMEPIDVQIKVLSDHRLSIHSVNPNPNVNLSVDMRCGPNGLLYGIPG
jgi:hypothetical protein